MWKLSVHDVVSRTAIITSQATGRRKRRDIHPGNLGRNDPHSHIKNKISVSSIHEMRRPNRGVRSKHFSLRYDADCHSGHAYRTKGSR